MQHNGFLWRALAVMLCFPASSAQAAPDAAANKQVQVMQEYFLAKLMEFGWGKIALIAVGAIVASFFVSLGVARLLAGRHGTFKNTLKYFVTSFFLSVIIAVVAGGIGWFCGGTGAPGGALVAGFFGLVGFVIVAFAVPIVIFDIGILRALVLNILIAIGNGVIQTAAMMVIPTPLDELQGKSDVEIRQIIGEWDMKRRQKEMEERMNQLAGSSPAPTESIAAQAQRLYAELQQERAKLDANDQAAVAAFNARVAEYNAVKAKLAPAK